MGQNAGQIQPNPVGGNPPLPVFGPQAPPPQLQPSVPQQGSQQDQPQQPQESKGHKLLQILGAGLQGALAGRAASEQAVLQSGGRRSGGAGLGFEAAYMLPWQRAQEMAKTQMAQQQVQPVPTPYGQLPGWLARQAYPAIIRGDYGNLQAATRAGATLGAAETRAGATEQAASTRANASENVARINQGMGIPVDPTTAQLIGMPEMAGQPAGRGTWTNINKSLEAMGLRVQDMGENGTGPNQGMWLMDRAGNRKSQISPNSLTFQRGASFAQNRPEVVVDPNDPGYAYFTSAANAMRNNLPSPQGAATQATKKEATSEVPTKVGDQKVAFNTALQHADLLQAALNKLNNPNDPSNVRTWNSVKNRFKTEFGSADVTNFQAIAHAYTNEVQKMLSGGHITEGEQQLIGGQLPANASPQQIMGALQQYRALAQSKLNMLGQQAQAATAPRGPKANQQGQGNGKRRTIIF